MNIRNKRFVWLIGAVHEEYPDVEKVYERYGGGDTVLWDRQERKVVVKLFSAYSQAFVLETTRHPVKSQPFTALENYFNSMTKEVAESENLVPTKPQFNVPLEPSDEQYAAVEFPPELREYVLNGVMEFVRVEENKTIVFNVPREDDNFTQLFWHPSDPKTWQHDGLRFTLTTEPCDKHGNTIGPDEVEDPSDVDELWDWLGRVNE